MTSGIGLTHGKPPLPAGPSGPASTSRPAVPPAPPRPAAPPTPVVEPAVPLAPLVPVPPTPLVPAPPKPPLPPEPPVPVVPESLASLPVLAFVVSPPQPRAATTIPASAALIASTEAYRRIVSSPHRHVARRGGTLKARSKPPQSQPTTVDFAIGAPHCARRPSSLPKIVPRCRRT